MSRPLRQQGKLLNLCLVVMAICATPSLTYAEHPRPTNGKKTRPNIVLCMADDQGWNEVAYNGHPHLKTPVLDEMARSGFRFDRFYSAASNCGLTRGSVMTGRNSNRFGLFGPTWAMRPEEITLAEILKDAGYATGHFGKWHLGPVKAGAPNNPGSQGFDEWLSHDNFFDMDPPLSRNGAPPEIFKGESSELIVGEAIEFIERAVAKDKPFFTVIWFGSCHGPYVAREADRKPYDHIDHEKLPNRYGEITAMDRSIGQLRNALKTKQLQHNTVLWYCSDNGVSDSCRYKPKLNGSKGNLFENGIRVPAIIEWPVGIPNPGHTSARCVTSDILPTVCEIVGLPVPDRVLDGMSVMPVINGKLKERPNPICFWHYDQGPEWEHERWMTFESQKGTTLVNHDVLTEFRNFKHPVAKTKDFGGDAAVLGNRFKLIIDTSGRHAIAKRTTTPITDKVSLFDLESDPGESKNVASEHPDIVDSMTSYLHQWQASVEQSLTGSEYNTK